MTASSLLTEIYQSKEIGEVISRIEPEHMRDDLKQHVFLILLEKEEAFILELNQTGKLKNYIVRLIRQVMAFTHGSFHGDRRKGVAISTDFSIIDETNYESGGMSHKAIYDQMLGTYQEEQSDKEQHRLEQACEEEIEKVYWYNAELLKRYVALGNYRAVAKETGIPVKSVYNAIKAAKEQIKYKVLCQS
jgi:DNA-directed RNA polymerase specialized sigma24 family protein